MRKQRCRWSENEIQILLQLWKENSRELTSIKRTAHIYEKIAEQLRKLGVNVTSNEVHFKINNLKQKFRESTGETIRIAPSGTASWKYFDSVKEIFEYSHDFPRKKCTSEFSEMDAMCSNVELQLPEMKRQFSTSTETFDSEGSSTAHGDCITARALPMSPNYATEIESVDEPAKKKKKSFRREFLEEFKRSNAASENRLQAIEKLNKEANELRRLQLRLTSEILNKTLDILSDKSK